MSSFACIGTRQAADLLSKDDELFYDHIANSNNHGESFSLTVCHVHLHSPNNLVIISSPGVSLIKSEVSLRSNK